MIAQNLGYALERYENDVTAAVEFVSAGLSRGDPTTEMDQFLRQLHILCVLNVDKNNRTIKQLITTAPIPKLQKMGAELFESLSVIAVSDHMVFSTVRDNGNGENVLFLIRDMDTYYAIAEISTQYFKTLGDSISFGIKGHAAIVDQAGNVLAHPNKDWVKTRKNISKVSSVSRMMRGETGIEEFYSPALKGDMIAGLTAVPGSGWGVMVPQPVSEIYDKVYQNQSSAFFVLGIGAIIMLALGLLFARSLSTPLEKLVAAMKKNARARKLNMVQSDDGLIPFAEIIDFRKNYNTMVRKVTQVTTQVETLAYSDSVTGLPNRDRLQFVAGPILRDATHPSQSGVVILVDLDNFKDVNDLHGHSVGDDVLRVSAQKLVNVASNLKLTAQDSTASPLEAPIVARIGGDEFIIVVQGMSDEAEIHSLLGTLRSVLSTPVPGLPFNSTMSASIGCARFPADGNDVEGLIKRADIAMFHAKNGGKNRAEIFNSEIGTQSSAEMRRDILEAIETGGLFLEYQPKVCSRRQKATGVEALVRWNHPEYGRYMPDRWMPAISNSPIIVALGEWVIEQAMLDQKKLVDLGHGIFTSVNIGSRHFVAPEFVESVDRIRDKLGFAAERLEIEVTEDALFTSEDRASSTFKALHERGYRLSIDDFGKGYSNIARLARLPVDFIKIDRSIIVGAYEDERICAILKSIITMAKSLGAKTVAEGVETIEQVEFASKMGADCLQGYYYAKAMPVEALAEWLDTEANASVPPRLQSL
ncbi:bifunctional diguanylate cyclase/phosphodiesterase [Roseibium algae]|uniref:EAL domain-containing protein n=1 Tax=Roseibium algae TaxID=3123038 RepID=A0ABU8TQM1_9HYPH